MNDTTESIYERAKIGGRYQLGERPAVLVVDFSRAFADPDSQMGMDLSGPIGETRKVLDAARSADVPVIFLTIAYDPSGADGGVWFQKMPGMFGVKVGDPATEIDDRLARQPDEVVITKKGASGFFGTNLSAVLAALRVDTVIMCGATTSGCVRATAIDLMQYGYPNIVPRECVGDRAPGPHEANLVDMDAKYSDVVGVADALRYLEAVSSMRRQMV